MSRDNEHIEAPTGGLKIGDLFWQKWAIRVFFFIGGFGIASWAPLIPFLKERLAIDEGTLGGLLLCIGIGSLFTMPTAAALVNKFDIKRVLLTVNIIFAGVLISLNLVNHLIVAAVLLLLFGATMGSIDVIVNIAAVTLERGSKRQLMSGLHAMWSVGGFTAAGLFSLLLYLGVPLLGATITASIIIIALAVVFSRVSLVEARKSKVKSKLISIPKGIVVFIGVATFITFLMEGAIMDWSGVFLLDIKGLEKAYASLGFFAFSASMLLMRFTGDSLIMHFGAKKVISMGTVCSMMGFLVVIYGTTGIINLGGFFLIGIGLANIVPTFFSLIGRQSDMPIGAGVSAVSTLGYLGVIVGPASIGFIAHATSLFFSFYMLIGLLLALLIIMFYTFSKVE